MCASHTKLFLEGFLLTGDQQGPVWSGSVATDKNRVKKNNVQLLVLPRLSESYTITRCTFTDCKSHLLWSKDRSTKKGTQ